MPFLTETISPPQVSVPSPSVMSSETKLFSSTASAKAPSCIHGEILTLGQMAAKVMFDGRGAQGHIQCLCHMQCTGLAVRTDTAVVVDAVGHVGVLLHLGHDDAWQMVCSVPDGIKKQSPLCTGTAFRTSVRVLFLMRSANSSLEISRVKP